MQFLAVDPLPGATSTRCIAISRCCIFRCRHTQTSLSGFKHLFCNKYPLHAISCCCMQFRVVACNFVLLHATSWCFSKTRGTSAHRQQQHYLHTNISSYSLWPRPSPPAPNCSINGPPSTLWVRAFHKLCGNCRGLPNCFFGTYFGEDL